MSFGKSREEDTAQKELAGLASAQAAKARWETGAEKQLYGKATGEILPDILGPLQALLKGDNRVLSRFFAPSIEAERAAVEGAKREILTTVPAGGEQNLLLGQLEANLGREIGDILAQAPQLGAQGLTSIFQSLLGISPQYGYAGSQSAGTGAGASTAILQSEAQRRAAQAQLLGSLLGGVGQAAGAVTFNELFG